MFRVRLSDGSYPYLRVAFAKNGRLKPGFGMQGGRAVAFADCTYHLRFRESGKRKWEAIGADPSTALAKLAGKASALGEVESGDDRAEPPKQAASHIAIASEPARVVQSAERESEQGSAA